VASAIASVSKRGGWRHHYAMCERLYSREKV
jgi:hypothetical protein